MVYIFSFEYMDLSFIKMVCKARVNVGVKQEGWVELLNTTKTLIY